MDRDRDEDTLSFSAFVWPNTPERPPTSSDRARRQLLEGPSFKFHLGISPPPSYPADVLFADGAILPNDSFPKGRKELRGRQTGNRRSAESARKGVSFEGCDFTPKGAVSSPVTVRSANVVQIRDVLNTEREAEKSKGILWCCRDCRATEPSKRVVNVAN